MKVPIEIKALLEPHGMWTKFGENHMKISNDVGWFVKMFFLPLLLIVNFDAVKKRGIWGKSYLLFNIKYLCKNFVVNISQSMQKKV